MSISQYLKENPIRIGLIETDASLREILLSYLKDHFVVELIPTVHILSIIEENNYDVIVANHRVIDNTFLGEFRKHPKIGHLGLLILIDNLTNTKSHALATHGADGIISTPPKLDDMYFRIITLALRSRNFSHLDSHRIVFNQYTLDTSKNKLIYQNKTYELTPLQVQILSTFISKPNQTIHRTWLKEHIWKDLKLSNRTIDAHISKLKKTLPFLQKQLISVYGKGYALISKKSSEAA